MNSPQSPIPSADEEAAALWAARLEAGPLSAAALGEFETWLAGHPDRRQLVADYCEFAADVGRLLPVLAAEGRLPAGSAGAARPRAHRRFTAFALGGALATAATIALFVVLGRAPRAPLPQEFATAAVQRHSLTLADGTHIDLAARTRVTVELGQAARRVQLTSGQAFFAVAKDAGKPFTVETPAGSVLVTGTRFAVRTETTGGLDVVVAEGQVRVSPAASAAPVTLNAGQHLVVRDAGLAVDALTPEALADTLAWREGQVVFSGTPLGEALTSFARHHGRALTASGGAAALRIGGRYNLDDLDGFLDGLGEILPLQIARGPDGAVQVALRNQP